MFIEITYHKMFLHKNIHTNLPLLFNKVAYIFLSIPICLIFNMKFSIHTIIGHEINSKIQWNDKIYKKSLFFL